MSKKASIEAANQEQCRLETKNVSYGIEEGLPSLVGAFVRREAIFCPRASGIEVTTFTIKQTA